MAKKSQPNPKQWRLYFSFQPQLLIIWQIDHLWFAKSWWRPSNYCNCNWFWVDLLVLIKVYCPNSLVSWSKQPRSNSEIRSNFECEVAFTFSKGRQYMLYIILVFMVKSCCVANVLGLSTGCYWSNNTQIETQGRKESRCAKGVLCENCRA